MDYRQKLIALWAFAEAGLGGVLHAFKIPFTGIWIGGFSVLCLTLLAKHKRQSYTDILWVTAVVCFIKFTVSPFTPPTAYVAVVFQGLCSYVFFGLFGVRFWSILFVTIITFLESATQSLLMMWLFFQSNLTNAIDKFLGRITKEIMFLFPFEISPTLFVAMCYLLIYLLAAILVGVMISRVAFMKLDDEILTIAKIRTTEELQSPRKSKFPLITLLVTIGLLLIGILANYQESKTADVFVSFIKSILVIGMWYLVVIPLFVVMMKRIFKNRSGTFIQETNLVSQSLPQLRSLFGDCYTHYKDENWFRRMSKSISSTVNIWLQS